MAGGERRSKVAFQPGPESLNRVQLRRIWWQKNQAKAIVFGKTNKLCLAMERSVIHHDHSPRRKSGKKLFFKPELKQAANHRTRIFHRRDDLLTELGRNNPDPFILAAADRGVNFLASGSISIFPVQICVDPGLVHISDLFRRDVCDLFLIGPYLFRVLLPEMYRLFLRVMPNRLNALRMAVSQQPNALAISFGYASGCSCTYVFSFSGSIFLYPRTTGLGVKVPFSFHCFSHVRIVLIATLNTRCVSSSVCPSSRYSIVRFR